MAEKRLIICNTSPIINLAETGLMELFGILGGDICIPPAVCDELLAKSDLFPKAAAVPDSGRFSIQAPSHQLLVESYVGAALHRGEAECLALAMENPGSLLILDDVSARTHASANHLPFTGTLGILAVAKAGGHLCKIAPVLQQLRIHARFWISPQLERHILIEAGEIW